MASVSKFTTGTQGSLYTRNLASQIHIEELGDWRALSMRLGSLPKKVREIVIDAMDFYGHKYHREILKTIKSNGRNLDKQWEPLNSKYLSKKMYAGGSPGIYVWTGTLRDAIQVIRSEEGLVTVGIDKKAKGSGKDGSSHLTASQIAHILQNGSLFHNIPARPLFQPVWRQMGGNAALGTYVKKKLDTRVKDHLLNIKT